MSTKREDPGPQAAVSPGRAQASSITRRIVEAMAGRARLGDPVRVEARSAVIYKKPVSIIDPDYVWAHTSSWINFPWSTLPVIRP